MALQQTIEMGWQQIIEIVDAGRLLSCVPESFLVFVYDWNAFHCR
jgi:hypothetical protein